MKITQKWNLSKPVTQISETKAKTKKKQIYYEMLVTFSGSKYTVSIK